MSILFTSKNFKSTSYFPTKINSHCSHTRDNTQWYFIKCQSDTCWGVSVIFCVERTDWSVYHSMVCDPGPELLTMEWPSYVCADATQISYLQIQACRDATFCRWPKYLRHLVTLASYIRFEIGVRSDSSNFLFFKVLLRQNVSETYFFRKC